MKKEKGSNSIDRLKSLFRMKKFHKNWLRVLSILGAVVVFCTVYALILPAATMEKNKATQETGVYLDNSKALTKASQDSSVPNSSTESSKASGTDSEYLNGTLTHEVENSNAVVKLEAKSSARIPKTATLKVEELNKDSEAYKANLKLAKEKAAKNGTSVSFANFFNITLLDENGKEIQPQDYVSVKVEFKKAISTPKEANVQAVHIKGSDVAEVLNVEEKAENRGKKKEITDVKFNASGFSVYGIVGTNKLETKYITADGKTWSVKVAYDSSANIPEGATLDVKEIDKNSDTYDDHLKEAMEKATPSKDEYVVAANFFSVKIMSDGKEVQPATPVKISLKYEDKKNSKKGDYTYKAIHFGHSGTEVITPEKSEKSGSKTELVYTQKGFSDIGSVRVEKIGSDILKSALGARIGAEPAHEKVLTPNGDGTYKLSLSVTGKSASSHFHTGTRANVLFVIDTSTSMYDPANDGTKRTKMQATKQLAQDMATRLLKNNTSTNPTAIELALISFDREAYTQSSWTTNEREFNKKIANLEQHKGTNWQDALNAAKKMSSDGDPTYVIFLTDGKPTQYRDENGEVQWGTPGHHGQPYHAFTKSLEPARKLVESGRTLYGIYAFDGRAENLKDLINYAYNSQQAANRYHFYAENVSALEKALKQIETDIITSVGFKNVSITDGLTDWTGSMLVEGKSDGFTYSRSGGKYGKGQNWTDAPKAVYSGGQVKWNLSSLGTLEDGVTYKVSFTVWPKQAAYDLMADLHNGKVSYDNLPPEQKSMIVNKNGIYSLKTNTEAFVDYKKVKTENGKEVEGETGYSTYGDPEPMRLSYTMMKVTKKWVDNTLDNKSTRPNPIKVWILKDGAKYKEVTLSQANNWEQTVYIAPGLKVKPGDHGTAKTGSNAGIIQSSSGHVYTVAEEGIDRRYELDVSPVKPLLDGTTTNTTDDLIDGLSNTKWRGNTATITAKNILKNSLKISKVVTTKDDASDSITVDKTFKINLSLTNRNGQPLTTMDYDKDGKISNGELQYAIYDKSNPGSPIKTGAIDSSVMSFDLKTSQYVKVINIPSGASYTVTEDQSSIPAGYKFLKIANGTGRLDGDKSVDVTVYNKRNALNVAILKVDTANVNKVLQGAEFVLYKKDGVTEATNADGQKIGKLVTNSEGKVVIGKLLEGEYVLKETKAPSGYKRAAPITVHVLGNKVVFTQQGIQKDGIPSADGFTYTMTITNSSGTELPMTGGSGVKLLMIIGTVLVVVSLSYGFKLWYRRERGEE